MGLTLEISNKREIVSNEIVIITNIIEIISNRHGEVVSNPTGGINPRDFIDFKWFQIELKSDFK